MTKRYERELKEVERLEIQNRYLKHEVKRLKKQLKTTSKGYQKFLTSDTEKEEQEAIQEAKDIAKKICFECRTGELVLIELGVRYFRKCNNCDRKTKTKPISELKR